MDKYVKDSDIYDIVMSQFCASSDETEAALNAIIEGTRALPPADVRPVVLCQDCKYCLTVDEYERWCNGFCSPARLVCADDYCSHGERRNVQ